METGNQTGAIQGTGIRNKTSWVKKDGGHCIASHKPT